MAAAERKSQVAELTMSLVAEHGVEATTIARIAAAAHISEAGLYRHFQSRQEILAAALEVVYENIAELFKCQREGSIPDQLRAIGDHHSSLVGSGETTFMHAFFEFLAAPRDLGLRQVMAQLQIAIIGLLTDLVEHGKAEGSLRPDLNAEIVSWELHGIYWSEAITHVMGINGYIDGGISVTILENLIKRISATV